jgi:CHAT domain-containing protein
MVRSNSLIQKVTTSQSMKRRDIFAEGKTVEELQNLPLEYTNTPIEELTKDNHVYAGINFSPNLDIKFNKEIAILYIESEEGQYRVRARTAEQKQLDTELCSPPELSFSQQMEGDNIPEKLRQISGRMRMFSTENKVARQISGWLMKLQQTLQTAHNQKLSCIVINDRTDSEIPWEMLELSENHYLGASLVTVRWQDIENNIFWDDTNSLINLEFQEEHCCGDIVAYTNTTDFKNVEQEITTLNQFNNNFFQSIYDFLEYLEQINSEISLMFIASHGFFGDDISQMYLGEDDTKQRISLPQLYDYDFDFFKSYHSIVFMNACHSGRLRRDEKLDIINHNYRIGFATFFLKKGARGVIGTLGKVIDQYAAKVTSNFFAEYQRNPNLPVAAILRNIRAEAAKNFRANKTEENRRLFIFTFMYVYYGNPMTTLRLNSPGN